MKSKIAISLIAAATLALAGCGTDQRNTITLTGTAATGAAMVNSVVEVVNTNGEVERVTTDAQGRFSATVNEGAPYLLSAADASGNRWYSYANGTTNVANITPLTTLAVLDASGNRSLQALAANWYRAILSDADVVDAAKRVNAHFQGLISGAGLDPRTVNVFTQPFQPNGLGLDAVLDAMRVSLSCSATSCAQSIRTPSGTPLVNWNPQIPITGFTITWAPGGVTVAASDGTTIGTITTPVTGASSGTGSTGAATPGSTGTIGISLAGCSATAAAGTYSLRVAISTAGFAGPEICIDGLPDKPTDQRDFCSDSDVLNELPTGVTIVACSWADPVGTISASITTAGVTFDYLATYTFVRR